MWPVTVRVYAGRYGEHAQLVMGTNRGRITFLGGVLPNHSSPVRLLLAMNDMYEIGGGRVSMARVALDIWRQS